MAKSDGTLSAYIVKCKFVQIYNTDSTLDSD